MPHTRVEFDSSLSFAMIQEALSNPMVKALLANVATRLQTDILSVIIQKESSGEKPVLRSLALQHANGDRYVGALLPDYTPEHLEGTPAGRQLLLSAIRQCLETAGNIDSCHAFCALMKAIDGMAFMHDVWETAARSASHLRCTSYIAPTADEVSMRDRRPGDLLATTYGIGTEVGRDLVPAETVSRVCLSGKARFFILPPAHPKRTCGRTWFEKLVRDLPLIAGPSNAAAKVFIMAQSMGLFLRKDESEQLQLDLGGMQIFANCVMAYLVFCGHHSFLEVIETWNRLLDFLLIEHPELFPRSIFPEKPETAAVGAVEEKLHAKIGNYSEFLHFSYRERMMVLTECQLKDGGLDLRFGEGAAGEPAGLAMSL